MWKSIIVRIFICVCVCAALPAHGVRAQDLRSELDRVFSDVLELRLAGSDQQNRHAGHFRPEVNAGSQRTIGALASLIQSNLSSYPLSSTSAGTTFDLSTGVPIATTTSAGAIFGERATTIGKSKLHVGANLSVLNLSRIRGLPLEDMSFNFMHQNVTPNIDNDPSTDETIHGVPSFEQDFITLDMNLDLSATIFAASATYGLTDRIDLGVAIPVINISMSGSPTARMNSYTHAFSGEADHFYGGSPAAPVLVLDVNDINESTSGIGDIALRGKGNFYRGPSGDLAALVEVRLPTGNEDDFLGSGDLALKFGLVGSSTYRGLNPHINVAYDVRTSDIDRNELEIILGHDQKVGDKLTIAFDWMGSYEVGSQIDSLMFPAPTSLSSQAGGSSIVANSVPATNIPSFSADNIVDASFGIKYAPRENILLLANLLFPINNGGLRSDVVPTIGVEFNL